jgi:hypothetical protein
LPEIFTSVALSTLINATGHTISIPATRVHRRGYSASSWLPSSVTPESTRRCTWLLRKSAPVTYAPGDSVTVPPPAAAAASIARWIAFVVLVVPSPEAPKAFALNSRADIGVRRAPTSRVHRGRPSEPMACRSAAAPERDEAQAGSAHAIHATKSQRLCLTGRLRRASARRCRRR